VNYADDLVIGGGGNAEKALATMRGIMQKLKWTVNETAGLPAAGREV